MTWKIETTDVNGVRYLASYRLVSEFGSPGAEDEVGFYPPVDILDANRLHQWRVDVDVDGAISFSRQPQIAVASRAPASLALEMPPSNRDLVAAALPDILLAVADGADLATEVRKVLESLKPEDQSGTPV